MRINKDNTAKRLLEFENVCRNAGVKVTHQRREIFREVAATDEHPDVESVYKRVKVRIPEISLDTVYRTLWMLHDLGLVVALGVSQERVRFDANTSKHHHFVCTQCGMTRDFYSDDLDNLKIPDQVRSIGRIDATQVEVRGMCLKCIQKKQPPTCASRKKEST